jgi:hypothetical protein
VVGRPARTADSTAKPRPGRYNPVTEEFSSYLITIYGGDGSHTDLRSADAHARQHKRSEYARATANGRRDLSVRSGHSGRAKTSAHASPAPLDVAFPMRRV